MSLIDQAPKVYSAIQAVMKSLGRDGISKDRWNKNQRFNFRGIDDVYTVLNAALVNNGLLMLPRAVERTATTRPKKDGDGLLSCVSLKLEFDLVAVADGSKHVVSAYGEGMDTGDKATSKAESMAFKYAAFQVFCIPVEGVPDADDDSPEPSGAPSASLQKIIDAIGDNKPLRRRVMGAYGTEDLADIPEDKHAEILTRLKALTRDE
jgi:ERF superfamily